MTDDKVQSGEIGPARSMLRVVLAMFMGTSFLIGAVLWFVVVGTIFEGFALLVTGFVLVASALLYLGDDKRDFGGSGTDG